MPDDTRVPFPSELRLRFNAFLAGRVGAFFRDRLSAPEMYAVAAAFGLARAFGWSDVPEPGRFLTGYATTIGPIIYATQDLGPVTLAHECAHVVDFYRDPVGFVSKYATDRGRMALEAHGLRAGLEVAWWLTGKLPASPEEATAMLRSYHPGIQLPLARDLLEVVGAEVAQGVIRTLPGRDAIGWLETQAPELKGRCVL